MKRSLLDPTLESFGMADTDQTCPVRFATTQPTQALGLLNSDFIQQQAELQSDFAARMRPDALNDQVSFVLQRVTQRRPEEPEVARGLQLIDRLQKERQLSLEEARTWVCLMSQNLNEFVNLD